MPSEQQHTVFELLARELERTTRGEDGWCWAWVGAVSFATGRSERWFEGAIFVDRERADEERARALVDELQQMLRRDHPEIPEPLRLSLAPTTRLDFSFALVASHFKIASYVDSEKMRRAGTAWVTLGEIERVFGWTAGEDRIYVHLAADSSADEEAAQELGEAWLTQFRATFPEAASLVRVIGESH